MLITHKNGPKSILDMVTLPVIDVPTALVAVILSVLANFVKEEIQRIQRQQRKEQQGIKTWLSEIVTLSREIQIAAMSHQANLEFFNEEAPPPDKFDNINEMGRYLDIDQQLLDGYTEFIGSTEVSEDPIVNFLEERRREMRSSFLEGTTEELQSYYVELKSQWAAILYDIDDENIVEVRDE